MTGEGSTLAIELGSSITPLPVPQRSTDVVDAFATRAVSAGDDLTITLIPQTSAETGLSARDYLTLIAHITSDGRVVFSKGGAAWPMRAVQFAKRRNTQKEAFGPFLLNL